MLLQMVLQQEFPAARQALVVLVQVALLVVLSQQAQAGEAAGSLGSHMVDALFHGAMECDNWPDHRGWDNLLVAPSQVQLIVTEVAKDKTRTSLAPVLPNGH